MGRYHIFVDMQILTSASTPMLLILILLERSASQLDIGILATSTSIWGVLWVGISIIGGQWNSNRYSMHFFTGVSNDIIFVLSYTDVMLATLFCCALTSDMIITLCSTWETSCISYILTASNSLDSRLVSFIVVNIIGDISRKCLMWLQIQVVVESNQSNHFLCNCLPDQWGPQALKWDQMEPTKSPKRRYKQIQSW